MRKIGYTLVTKITALIHLAGVLYLSRVRLGRPDSANRNTFLARAHDATKESKQVDFKESCDFDSPEHSCEIVKDIVAMANSGGGTILLGVRNDGFPAGINAAALLAYDPAKITDKVAKYTGHQFANFEWVSMKRDGVEIATLLVLEGEWPMVFSKAGTYVASNGKDKCAFHVGTLYVRHGAKSEPADSDDLRRIIDGVVTRTRREWLSGVKKVAQAPPGSSIQVVAKVTNAGLGGAAVARIVSNKDAPAVRLEDANKLFPHLGKDVIASVNRRLDGQIKINTYDFQCVKKVFRLENDHPELCYRPFLKGSVQFSDKLIEWLVEHFSNDRTFFSRTRAEADKMKGTGSSKL